MNVAYLIEYRQTPATGCRPSRWRPIGVICADTAIGPAALVGKIRATQPALSRHEIRVRLFHRIPGIRLEDDSAGLMVIEIQPSTIDLLDTVLPLQQS